MNEIIEQCMYESGLTAQGCWDELDDYAKEAIERFAKLLFQKAQQEFALQELANQAQELGIE
jgi:hypothetical protein